MPTLPGTSVPCQPPAPSPAAELCESCEQHDCMCPECPGCATTQPNTTEFCESCHNCPVCCECVACRNCHAQQSSERVCSTCDSCLEDCCQCFHCTGCDERRNSEQSPRCDTCDACDSCCSCLYCEGCDACHHQDTSDWCSDCDRCLDTCICETESTSAPVEFFHSPLYFHHAKPTDFTRNKSRRFISCEIEVAEIEGDARTSDTVRGWCGSIVSDGSLSNQGFEINTAPAHGDLFVRQAEEVCQALEHDGASVSRACGLHVHIDARDFSYYDLRRMVLLYERIEPALFEMMPDTRRHSHYCQPCGVLYAEAVRANRLPKLYKELLIKSVYGAETKRPPRRDKFDGARYHALNLHSWFYRGTIECRLHTGTVRAGKIIA